MTTPSKQTLVMLLREWINKRPGLDPRDYGAGQYDRDGSGWRNYRNESARITEQKHDAARLLQYFENSSMTPESLIEGFKSAYSGRLSLEENEKGFYLSYCTGQYFPTEYRAAAAAVLASAIWYYLRDDYKDCEHIGDEIRKAGKRIFGKSIGNRWFN